MALAIRGPGLELHGGMSLPLLGVRVDALQRAQTGIDGLVNACSSYFQEGGSHVDLGTSWQGMGSVTEARTIAGLSREDVFLTYHISAADMGYDRTLAAAERAAAESDSYIDLLLLSSPGDLAQLEDPPPCSENGWRSCITGSWAAMEHSKRRGFVRTVGVAGFEVDQFKELVLVAKELPAVALLEMDLVGGHHIPLMRYCAMNDIQVLASGFFERPGLVTALDAAAQGAAEQGGRGVVASLLALRWAFSRGIAALVPPAEDQVKQSFSVVFSLDAPLPEEVSLNLDGSFWHFGSPVLAPEQLGFGSAGCTSKREVKTFQACEDAIHKLGLRPAPAVKKIQSETLPRGCLVKQGAGVASIQEAYYNAHPAGAARSDVAPVCLQETFEPRQGRTLFLSMCMGTEYFGRYCAPFLASFLRVFGSSPRGWHSLRIWTVGVSNDTMMRAHALFDLSGVVFDEEPDDVALQRWSKDFGGSLDDIAEDGMEQSENASYGCKKEDDDGSGVDSWNCAKGPHDERVRFNNIMFFRWARKQLQDTQNDGFDWAVVMDSDTLFVQSMEMFLPRRSEDDGSFDYAFTHYDEGHIVPWGSNSDVSRTANGFVRLNGGIQLLRHSNQAHNIVDYLVQVTGFFLQEYRMHEARLTTKDMLREFKGPSQAAISALVHPENLYWGQCLACYPEVASVSVEREDGTTFQVRVQGLPARYLNQAESLPEGKLTKDTAVLHLKGTWWRMLINNELVTMSEHRALEWNIEAYELWMLFYRVWNPEWKGLPALNVLDSEALK